jgi:plastocyanin
VPAVFFLLAVLIGSSIVFFARGSNNHNPANPPTNSSAIDNGSGRTIDVHMKQTNFDPPAVTISVGDRINLINDVSVRHAIENGTWEENTAKPGAEPDAPVANSEQLGSASQNLVLGPFTTAGTFRYFCTIHPGMNLTVIVQ